MSEIIEYHTADPLGREMFSIHLPSLVSLPKLTLPGKKFACLVACDASSLSHDDLKAFATNMINQGAVYACSWGPGCARLEGAFDEADHIEREDSPVVITTSHDGETIGEALWFLLSCASPDPEYLEQCTSSIAVVVGNDAWYAQVHKEMSSPRTS
jgi:hypothetical protein